MIGLTCPHCESALTIPSDCINAQIACPGCRNLLPNPIQLAALDAGIYTAQLLDHEAIQARRQKAWIVTLVVLALFGALAAAIWTASILRGSSLAFFLPPALPVVCLFAVSFLGHVGWDGVWRHRSWSCEICWIIVELFALVGALALCFFVFALAAMVLLAISRVASAS